MKINTKYLLLSAAALLVVIILVIVIRRRGRKVYLKEQYRLNEDSVIYIFDKDKGNSVWFKGLLDYVVLPFDYKKKVWYNTEGLIEPDGTLFPEYVPVKAVGEKMPSGKIKTVYLKDGGLIASELLNI